MTSWPVAVIFDLDGTLIETLPDIHNAANGMLADHGLKALSADTVRGLIGKGSRNLVERSLRLHDLDPSETEIDNALQSFLDHYDRNPTGHGYVYPGVTAALDALKAAGRRLGVCTNKQKVTTTRVLDGFGLAPYFDAVIGGDEAAFRKPDPRHILEVLDRMDVPVDQAAFVGDSENDIEAAQRAGIPCVAVSFGYCHVPFEDLGPNAIVDHYDDLLAALDRLRP